MDRAAGSTRKPAVVVQTPHSARNATVGSTVCRPARRQDARQQCNNGHDANGASKPGGVAGTDLEK
jgi:hypothetical protein